MGSKNRGKDLILYSILRNKSLLKFLNTSSLEKERC
jgi:hypothetical protein